MNKSNLIIGIVAVAALIVGFVAYGKSPELVVGSQGAQGPRGEQGLPGPAGRDGKDGVTKVVYQTPTPNPVLGALSGPDIPSPYLSFGGVRLWAASTDSLTSATTTVCALQSPSATTTLDIGTFQVSVSSTTATTITLAKAATAYATTTSLGSITIGANAQGLAVASTTGSHVFSPNTFFVVGMAGGIGTFSPTGSCKAVWQQL